MERSGAFWRWVALIGRPELLPARSAHGRLGYRQTIQLSGLPPIHVIGLESAWLAGDDHDAGRLVITEDQVNRLTE